LPVKFENGEEERTKDELRMSHLNTEQDDGWFYGNADTVLEDTTDLATMRYDDDEKQPTALFKK